MYFICNRTWRRNEKKKQDKVSITSWMFISIIFFFPIVSGDVYTVTILEIFLVLLEIFLIGRTLLTIIILDLAAVRLWI